ncbi:MAG: mannosyltransferase family protein [Microcoleus sp.]
MITVNLKLSKAYFIAFLKSDAGKALLIALCWQFLMTLLGIIIERGLVGFSKPGADLPGFVKPGAGLPAHTLLSHTLHWDGYWFEGITHGLYSHYISAPAFYPLFPLLVLIVGTLSFHVIGTLAAGLLINTVALWLAILALYKIALKFLDRPLLGWCVVGLFLASPAAFFLHTFYSEAVFCALAFGAYYFALEKRWALVGVSLGLLTASRITAILVVALCLLEYIRNNNWEIKKTFNKSALWFLLSPVGILLYGASLYVARGDFLGMVHSYKLWSYHVFNLNFVATYYHALVTGFNGIFGMTSHSHSDILVNFILPVVALTALLAASIIAIFRVKGRGVPLGIAGLISFIMFTLNSDVNSVHRYVLPCLVVYVAAIYVLNRFRAFPLIFAMSLFGCFILQMLLYTLFISGYFAG